MKEGGLTTYDIRHEATQAGEHFTHITLHGQPIRGSPVSYVVNESTPEVRLCQLTPPPEPTLYSNETYTIVLQTFDRFGNKLSTGGLPVSTRLQLIKQGVHDLTTLMPNNHTIEVEDQNDGSYHQDHSHQDCRRHQGHRQHGQEHPRGRRRAPANPAQVWPKPEGEEEPAPAKG